LDQSQAHYIPATAYDTSGNESALSNEVIYDLAQSVTDGDGLSDWAEISVHEADPNRADSDGDGLSDGKEVRRGIDPLLADTDGDGVDCTLD
jgi:hypothetical protein